MTEETLIHPTDILKLALEKEKQALDFYTSHAEKAADPALRTTFLEMAEEERGHIRKIEDELDRFFQPDN
jgi:rubrerythrin